MKSNSSYNGIINGPYNSSENKINLRNIYLDMVIMSSLWLTPLWTLIRRGTCCTYLHCICNLLIRTVIPDFDSGPASPLFRRLVLPWRALPLRPHRPRQRRLLHEDHPRRHAGHEHVCRGLKRGRCDQGHNGGGSARQRRRDSTSLESEEDFFSNNCHSGTLRK